MLVVVGSTSDHKIGAVSRALALARIQAEIRGCRASSSVPEQPWGDEMMLGAKNRAQNAFIREAGATLYVGIESGLERRAGRCYDFTAIAIFDPVVNRMFTGWGGGHEVPDEYVAKAILAGFAEHTAGEFMAKATGCSSTDGSSFITDGLVSREDVITQGVMIALGDWMRQTIRLERRQ